jgi:hypothetical protein
MSSCGVPVRAVWVARVFAIEPRREAVGPLGW